MNKMQNHQQALIVVLSYVIGFITAFIMFGLADLGKGREEVHLNQVPENMLSEEDVVIEAPRLEETEEGLFLMANGEQQIISALTDAEEADPGFHLAISASSISPDNNYVLYCAQVNSAAEECQYFIYSSTEHMTYPIKFKDGTPLVVPNDEAEGLSWTDASKVEGRGNVASAESLWVFSVEGCDESGTWGGACGL